MIIVSVNVYPKPEDKQKYLEEFEIAAKETRNEKGCICYHIYHPEGEPDRLHIYEKWESKADLLAHLNSDHITEFLTKTKDWLKKEVELEVFEASQIEL